MNEPLVRAAGISRSFDDGSEARLSVLVGIACRIDAGDRIALVGSSGSGKSTLLHILGGLDNPTSGEISWPALGVRQGLRPGKIGLVFQAPSLFPALTIIQNVSLPLLLLGSDTGAYARAAALLERFDLSALADKLPEELSGGQAQRVAMARAMVAGPQLILADEPTGQLDSATAQRFFDLVLDIVDETEAALLVATHDETVAARMDDLWRIDHGRLGENADRRKKRA